MRLQRGEWGGGEDGEVGKRGWFMMMFLCMSVVMDLMYYGYD